MLVHRRAIPSINSLVPIYAAWQTCLFKAPSRAALAFCSALQVSQVDGDLMIYLFIYLFYFIIFATHNEIQG